MPPTNEGGIWARTPRAQATGEAIAELLAAEQTQTKTVQWMPDGRGCRFEILDVQSGECLGIAHVHEDGSVNGRTADTVTGEGLRSAGPASAPPLAY